MLPVELMKVADLENLFDIYARIHRDGVHVTTKDVNPDREQAWEHKATHSLKRAFKLEPIALEYTSRPSHVR